MTINHLVALAPADERDRFHAIYLKRLEGYLPAVARIAVIDGLTRDGVPIPKAMFAKLLANEDFRVRVAVVENLQSTAATLPQTDRVARMALASSARPYQLRLEAFRSLAKLSLKERAAVRARMPASVCSTESRTDVRSACTAAIGGAK